MKKIMYVALKAKEHVSMEQDVLTVPHRDLEDLMYASEANTQGLASLSLMSPMYPLDSLDPKQINFFNNVSKLTSLLGVPPQVCVRVLPPEQWESLALSLRTRVSQGPYSSQGLVFSGVGDVLVIGPCVEQLCPPQVKEHFLP